MKLQNRAPKRARGRAIIAGSALAVVASIGAYWHAAPQPSHPAPAVSVDPDQRHADAFDARVRHYESFRTEFGYLEADVSHLSVAQKAARERRLQRLEEEFTAHEADFRMFLESELENIVSLTSAKEEISGVVMKEGQNFALIGNSYTEEFRTYVKEIANDDYSHAKEIKQYIMQVPEAFVMGGYNGGADVRTHLSGVVDTMQLYATHLKGRDIRGIVLEDAGGRHIGTADQVRITYEMGHALFVSLDKLSGKISLHDPRFDSISGVYGRFHTHPKDGKDPSPSDVDRATTIITGPGVLFAQEQGVLHVHGTVNGVVKEIFRKQLLPQ